MKAFYNINADYQEGLDLESDRIKVISAIIADNKLRYAGTSVPQKSGRFNIPLSCVGILNPKPHEEFVIVKDDFGGNGSIIITREKTTTQNDIILSRVKFGTGKKKLKKRIRLNQKLASMFGVCELGFSACDFRGCLSLRISPKVPEPDLNILKAKSVGELAKYVLWPGRSLKVITIANSNNPLAISSEISFKLLGGFYYIGRHSDPNNSNDKELICKLKNCKYCKSKEYPIHYSAFYIPVLADITTGHPRPILLKFTGKALYLAHKLVCHLLSFTKNSKSSYWTGPVKYNEKEIWTLYNDYVSGKIVIMQSEISRELTDSEKGWALSLRQKFKKIICDKENITTKDIIVTIPTLTQA